MKKSIDFSLQWEKADRAKIRMSPNRITLIPLFVFMSRNGFLSEQEQLLRLIDRPELLSGQVISFYNRKKNLRIDVELT